MEIEELPPLPSDKEVSAVTGIPVGTLKYFRHRGHGGPRSFALTPRQIRYKREDVIAWIDEQYEGQTGEAA